jgi:hypothetical protein
MPGRRQDRSPVPMIRRARLGRFHRRVASPMARQGIAPSVGVSTLVGSSTVMASRATTGAPHPPPGGRPERRGAAERFSTAAVQRSVRSVRMSSYGPLNSLAQRVAQGV